MEGIEDSRLAFIESSQGKDAALDFAKRTMRIYRKCVLQSYKIYNLNPHRTVKPHHASFPQYRRGFIESYCAFKKYIKEHDNQNEVT